MIIRPVLEISLGAFVVAGGMVNGAIKLAEEITQEPSFTPQAIIGVDALVNWSLVLVGATVIWRAAATIKNIEASQMLAENAWKAALGHHVELSQMIEMRVSETIENLDRRVSKNEEKWLRYEATLIQFEARFGHQRRDEA